MAMQRVKVRIEGTTPLLMNRFTDEAAAKATAGTGASTPIDDGTPLEQCDKKVYRDLEGNTIMPQPNIYANIIEAGKFFKSGKSKITTLKTSLIPGAVEFDDIYYPVEHKEPWTVDTRPIRNPMTGGRRNCHRPCFHDWAVEYDFILDTDIISVKLMRQIIDAAGKRVGLCDYRPACKGPFGKYVVTHWENGDSAA